jgi:hypothetical protein
MAVELLQHVSDVRDQAAPHTGVAGALRLAGFALAHAALSIERDDKLCTLAAVAEDGELKRLYRYPAPGLETSVRAALDHLGREMVEGTHGALVYAGRVKLGKRRTSEALVVEILGPHAVDLGRLVQPYRRRRFRLPKLGYVRRFAIRERPIVDHLADEAEPQPREDRPHDVESRIYWGVHDHPDGVRLFRDPMRSHSRSSTR